MGCIQKSLRTQTSFQFLKIALVATLAFNAGADRAFAFPSDGVTSIETLGELSCSVIKMQTPNFGVLIYGAFAPVFAGGSYWNADGNIAPNTAITETTIAGCLGTPVSNIANLLQNGADGTYDFQN